MNVEVNSPIFVGGMFKSGTSLLRAMLGRHSMLAAGLETYWFDLDWDNQNEIATSERLRVIRDLFEEDEDSFFDIVSNSRSSEEFLSNFLNNWAQSKGKVRWVEKTPGNIQYLDRIYAQWPDAAVIHIIRDPRDIMASLLDAKKWDNIDMFMERWIPVFEKLNSFKLSGTLEGKKYHELKYEDLVADPAASLRNICDFLSIPFETGMAEFKGEKKDFEMVKNVTGKESSTLERLSKPLMTSRVGIWQEKLTEQNLLALTDYAEKVGLAECFHKACYP